MLVVPTLPTNNFSRHHSGISWRVLLVGWCFRFVFAMNYSESGSACVGCYYIISVSSRMCYACNFCYHFFSRYSVLLLFRSNSIPISSVVIDSFVRSFLKFWVKIFQCFVLLRGIISVFYLMLVILLVLRFYHSFVRFCSVLVISCRSQCFSSRKYSDIFLLALFPLRDVVRAV